MIQERLSALREEMKKRKIDIYIVPTADFHESEYVGEHFKARKFITGFTGSAGTAVITLTEAGLWTDGRYFVQAEKQLAGSTVTLYRMGEESVPTVDEFVEKELPESGCIGFDGRVVNGSWGRKLLAIAEKKKGSLYVTEDLIDLIWKDRPALSKEPLFLLEEKYSGKSTADKIADLRKVMEKEGANVHILTSLYDIAWLLNIRGGDIDYVPVILSYLVLTDKECIWFLQEEVVDEKIAAYLKENHITTRSYDAIYERDPHCGPTEPDRDHESGQESGRGGEYPQGTCEGRCGIYQVHVLAEDQHRQDPDDGDLRLRLPGGAQKRAG